MVEFTAICASVLFLSRVNVCIAADAKESITFYRDEYSASDECAARRCSAHMQHNRSRAVDGDVLFLITWVQSCIVYTCFKNTDLLVCSLNARLQTCKSTYKFLLQKQPSMLLNKHLSCSNCFVAIPYCRYILLNVILFLCVLLI